MPTFRNMNRMQLAISLFGLLTVCALVFGSVATIVSDLIQDDPTPFSSDQIATESEILEALEMTATAAPDNPAIALALANNTANTVGILAAIPIYQAVIEMTPDDSLVRIDFARSLERAGYSSDAEFQYLKAIELDPVNPSSHYYLAMLYERSEPPRLNEAIDQFELAVAVGGDSFLGEQAQVALIRLGVTSPVASPVPS